MTDVMKLFAGASYVLLAAMVGVATLLSVVLAFAGIAFIVMWTITGNQPVHAPDAMFFIGAIGAVVWGMVFWILLEEGDNLV